MNEQEYIVSKKIKHFTLNNSISNIDYKEDFDKNLGFMFLLSLSGEPKSIRISVYSIDKSQFMVAINDAFVFEVLMNKSDWEDSRKLEELLGNLFTEKVQIWYGDNNSLKFIIEILSKESNDLLFETSRNVILRKKFKKNIKSCRVYLNGKLLESNKL